jgi:hypothetical protein
MFVKCYTAVNIESDSVRLLSFKGNSVRKWGEAPVPPGLMKNGVVADPDNLSSIISGLFKTIGAPKGTVLTAVSGFRSIPRFISLPKLNTSQLKEAVLWAAQREMPVPLDTVHLSWQLLDNTGAEMRIFLLGTPRNIVEPLTQAFHRADIRLQLIENKLLVLGRLVNRVPAVIMNIEKDTISTVVKTNGLPVVMRTTAMPGTDMLTEDIAQKITDELFRTVGNFNSSNHGLVIDRDVPLIITGGMADDALMELLNTNPANHAEFPEPRFILPQGMSPARNAVNIGLCLRYNPGPDRKTQANQRSSIDLNILDSMALG